eukprot:CAMPEP_0178403592 /NCGR_PEP_ID=MMETSP0689_2-20121128/17448_1 /TAXON_ID=160604 /ORGANISM="Amphidinium massartii, Strain CS-259" /LENGTH=491 /DNA_ID=CAMNT_0020024551 /DNA_START=63 /DNA_END=1539 /DNA_ORIENTATION=+
MAKKEKVKQLNVEEFDFQLASFNARTQGQPVARCNATQTMAKKEKVKQLNVEEFDFQLASFTCKDSSALGALGKSCKETRWVVQVGQDPEAMLDLCVLVDKGLVSGPEVRVTASLGAGEQATVLHPPPGPNSEQKAKLKQDFLHAWPFRGIPKHMNTAGFYEVKPQALGDNQWFPAILKEYRSDEFFEAVVDIPGKGQVHLPATRKEDIREVSTKDTVKIPQHAVHLRIAAADPLHKVDLLADGMERIKFARPSPRPDPTKVQNVVRFSVDKTRTTVSANVGRSELDFFLNDEAKQSRIYNDKAMKTWTLYAGPYCEHEVTLQVEGKVFIVKVDGHELVHSSAEDLGCTPASTFKCAFSLVGNKTVEFEVNETNRDGTVLDSRGVVSTVSQFRHECEIACSGTNPSNASFVVNGVDFMDLPTTRWDDDQQLSMSPDALKMTYGLQVPYKVNSTAPTGGVSLASSLLGGTNSPGGPPSFGPFGFFCCTNPGV